MKTTIKSQRGTSLLEVLLYMALLAIIMVPISYFIPAMSEARMKNITISEVNQQGLQISRLITQTIRNAKSIDSPAQGANAEQLYLKSDLVGTTIFGLVGNYFEMSENGVMATMTSPQIIASNLTFFNYSAPDTPGNIRFQFTLGYKNISGRQEYNYSKVFTGGASLR